MIISRLSQVVFPREGETAYGIYNFGDSNTTTVSVGTLVGSNITTSGTGAHGNL